MSTRTSTRSTKAVKFVDSADDDEGEFENSSAMRIKDEPKKVKARGRARRTRTNDDEDWDARNEESDVEEEDDDDEESVEDEDATKKFQTKPVNRTIDSVYDFGEMSSTARKWTKTATPQRNSVVSDSGKSMEKLMCSYCNYTTTKKYLLQRHLKSHSTERPHKCAYCDRSFKTTIQLTNHVNTHLGVKPFQCKFCSFSFTTSGELIRHVRYKHTLEKPHRCEECGYATVELSKLRRHIRTHTGEKPYACPHCSYCSPDTFKLKRHLRVHTGERPYQCTICNFRFTQSNSLKAHMLTHQAEKPSFPCSYCPSVMARKSDLRYHIGKQHARQSEPLSCNKCDEDFPDKYSLRMHGKTHKGQTIHSCTNCEFSANTSQQLEDHMNKHRGTRPFQCSECGLMFAARADLRAHVTRTHRNALTPTTAATMNSPTTMNRRPQRRAASLQHRYIGASSDAEDDEQQEDDFRCPICHRQFTSARLLDRHTYAVHEPKQDSYDGRDYQTNEMDDEDDIRDYADDELEEKEKVNINSKNDFRSNQLKVEDGITDDEQAMNEEELDLAPNVEDIVEGDDDNEPILTIKSISSASRKQVGVVRKFDEVEHDDDDDDNQDDVPNKRKCNIIRASFKSNDVEKPDFDVFGFNG
ncbi:unnamed protein product [Rotaria socialis]|uniref:C2H2-type domain-containing protein n=1 Tax=Rotaria socialis TaxID=392032 RepID=A0A817V5U3_9BILA|nr:unnamed protein product [Rotaria socialis]CAF3344772.1 unnamed protein product [Rotaria socialis]CAF3665143.1 unnamed protein product [Rotaria socialis]CAF4210008.1 unnamed protein product [Rotaria socialis]CAF4380681.1 unnamed protein product [Rotaria socialis]